MCCCFALTVQSYNLTSVKSPTNLVYPLKCVSCFSCVCVSKLRCLI